VVFNGPHELNNSVFHLLDGRQTASPNILSPHAWSRACLTVVIILALADNPMTQIMPITVLDLASTSTSKATRVGASASSSPPKGAQRRQTHTAATIPSNARRTLRRASWSSSAPLAYLSYCELMFFLCLHAPPSLKPFLRTLGPSGRLLVCRLRWLSAVSTTAASGDAQGGARDGRLSGLGFDPLESHV
jgi:hypothetical protein